MTFTLRKGAEVPDALLQKGSVTKLVDPLRENVCKKKFMGLF